MLFVYEVFDIQICKILCFFSYLQINVNNNSTI